MYVYLYPARCWGRSMLGRGLASGMFESPMVEMRLYIPWIYVYMHIAQCTSCDPNVLCKRGRERDGEYAPSSVPSLPCACVPGFERSLDLVMFSRRQSSLPQRCMICYSLLRLLQVNIIKYHIPEYSFAFAFCQPSSS